jgi:hypothetical protein
MSVNIPNWYVNQYSTNIELLSQQIPSRFLKGVSTGVHVGKQASPVDQIGAIAVLPVESRFAPMRRVDANLTRRWALPNPAELPQLIDSFDMLDIITDPKSKYAQNSVAAFNRFKDDNIISGFQGTNYTGQNGTTATTFGSGVTTTVPGATAATVSVLTGGGATAVGMNVTKLRAAKAMLLQQEVDIESDEMFCAISAIDHNYLLNEIQIISKDYNSDEVLMKKGLIESYLGFNFIHSERMGTGTDDQSGTSRVVQAWAKSGLYLGIWQDTMTRISQREDLGGIPWQIYEWAQFGGTRLEEVKCVWIWCR